MVQLKREIPVPRGSHLRSGLPAKNEFSAFGPSGPRHFADGQPDGGFGAIRKHDSRMAEVIGDGKALAPKIREHGTMMLEFTAEKLWIPESEWSTSQGYRLLDVFLERVSGYATRENPCTELLEALGSIFRPGVYYDVMDTLVLGYGDRLTGVDHMRAQLEKGREVYICSSYPEEVRNALLSLDFPEDLLARIPILAKRELQWLVLEELYDDNWETAAKRRYYSIPPVESRGKD